MAKGLEYVQGTLVCAENRSAGSQSHSLQIATRSASTAAAAAPTPPAATGSSPVLAPDALVTALQRKNTHTLQPTKATNHGKVPKKVFCFGFNFVTTWVTRHPGRQMNEQCFGAE